MPLFVVATPIGNLADISTRALEVLGAVELVLAEDTAHSGKLLRHFGIKTPLKRYDAYQEKKNDAALRNLLGTDADIALISDAGSPLISDPGALIVRIAHSMKVRVIPIPGACAAVAALSASGFLSQSFVFGGYLPRTENPRRALLHKYRNFLETIVFYEVPHRIRKSLRDVEEVWGAERKAVFARELTKVYESVNAGTVAEIRQAVEEKEPKGEMVLVLEGKKEEKPSWDEEDARILKLLLNTLSNKQAADLAARIRGKSRNIFYRRALAIKDANP